MNVKINLIRGSRKEHSKSTHRTESKEENIQKGIIRGGGKRSSEIRTRSF